MNIKDLFEKYSLDSTNETKAISGLFGKRYLDSINSSPFYQRNYVWDIEKQTYFGCGRGVAEFLLSSFVVRCRQKRLPSP